MAFLAQPEAEAFHGPDVAIFPLRDFQRFRRHIGSRPLYAVALWFHSAWIDVKDQVLRHVHQQIALPKLYQQHTALGGVINVPRSRSFIIEAHNGERHRFPFDRLAGFAGLRPRTGREKRYRQREKYRTRGARLTSIKSRCPMRRAIYAMASAIVHLIREDR